MKQSELTVTRRRVRTLEGRLKKSEALSEFREQQRLNLQASLRSANATNDALLLRIGFLKTNVLAAEARAGAQEAKQRLEPMATTYERWGKDVKERLLTFLTPILGDRLAQNAVNELTRGRPTS